MKRILALLPLAATVLPAQAPPARPEPPAWAVPLVVGPRAPLDSVTRHRVPGSPRAFTERQANDRFDVPDWHPATHPAMPPIVAHGRRPAVWGCGYCHLPDGGGRPENAALAGLPAAYIERQVAAMRAGARASAWPGPNMPAALMGRIADSTTPGEVAVAARYFAGLRLRRRVTVVEAAQIPAVRPGVGLYVLAPGRGTEPLGRRLIEVPRDAARHELRDARVPYVAYVPPGSLARGRALAAGCGGCHGPALRGRGLAPPLAGRSPSYLFRQLVGFAAGTRAMPEAAPMRAVAASLPQADMIAAAAYAASLAPTPPGRAAP